jgi:acid phosphatase
MLTIRLRLLILTTAFALFGCVTTTDPEATLAHDNTDAVVWLQSSVEYAATTSGIYASATRALVELAESSSRPVDQLAIVLDIDETVLDNSAYQEQLIFEDEAYNRESWDLWLARRAATDVPGVVEFLQTAQSLGFHIAFITNRPCRTRTGVADPCPQKKDTRLNLEDIGIETTSTTLYLEGEQPPKVCRAYLTKAERKEGKWSSDKTSRRQCVSRDREIVMLFGDQLGDFVEEHGSESDRAGRETAQDFDQWGKSWFMLPNPTYGGWRPRTPTEKRELLRDVD